MNFRKQFIFLLTFLLLLPLLCVNVSAAEEPEFRYELTVDGKDTIEVQTGDLITVSLHLYRTDEPADYTMYAFQDEIRYNSTFFELVEDSPQLLQGVRSTDIRVAEDLREFYMSYLSFAGGEMWQQKTRIGTFQLRITGTTGTTTITNEDFHVSLPDGSDSYICEANVLTVVLTTECTVRFQTNGGTPIEPITVIYGETIARPENPIREGKHLVGWFKDIHLTEEWNFETDTVKGNMTLYAKWADGDPVISHGKHCIICGREDLLIPNVSLCWICLLILILIVLVVVLVVIIVLRKRKKPKHKGKFEQ